MTKLSIIIPCYNCSETLEAAVESIYRQDSAIPFDLTMVDDGSSDSTFKVMEALAARFPNVRLVRHASNRGGGAARNTAVANSDGELVFCLDSDDMLGPDFLRNMTGFWLARKCDGLGISKSIKFKNVDVTDVAYINEFEGPGEQVRFDSLFDSSRCSLYSTFLIGREAFYRIGGYPTDHGYDTQGMAFRFLCNGLTAYTCPGTVYYHRVSFHESYYTREDRAGRSHWNVFRILDEFLYLFKDEIKALILEHDVFPTQAQMLLPDEMREANKRATIFRDGHQDLIRLGRDRVAEGLRASGDKYDQYWLGTYLQQKERHAEALDYYVRSLKSGFSHRIIYCRLLEAALRVSGNPTPARIAIRDLLYYVNDPSRVAESAGPPLRGYQRFENWLHKQRYLSVVGKSLKRVRLFLRRFRRAKPV